LRQQSREEMEVIFTFLAAIDRLVHHAIILEFEGEP
jgi:hypothetical protein